MPNTKKHTMSTPTKRDYYEVLGVSKQADAKQIKDAFRELAMRYHPDRNKEAGAEERFKEIAEAYAILSDPEKKRQYDLQGFEGVSSFTPDDLFGGINFEDVFGFFGDPFERLFGRHRFYQRKQRGDDIELLIDVPLSKIMSGGSEKIQVARQEQCEFCHGSGIIIEKPCSQCLGTGLLTKEKIIEVVIPPGVEDGTILRVARQGRVVSEGDGPPGDLLVIVQTAKDPHFQRSGADLFYSTSIPVYDAVLGTKIRVPTLGDDVIVKVASGTKAQTSLRVKGKGLPKFQHSGYGDLFVVIDLQIPENLKSEEKKLYEELRTLAQDKDPSKTSWFSRLTDNI